MTILGDVAGQPVVEAVGVGRRYGRRWALRDCTLQLPAHAVVGLVGPNGAGKSTLLHLMVGLQRPSAGTLRVCGLTPGSRSLLPRVGFVAQDTPLYAGFSVADTLSMGGWLNRGWEPKAAAARLDRLGIPQRQRVGSLSGGQRAQVALAMALGKRPELLVLDEPVASLDPLARREFLQSVMAEVADSGATVVLSSHLLADLDRSCDHLVLLSASRVQLAGDVEDLRAAHALVTGPRARVDALACTHRVVQATTTPRQASLLIRRQGPILDPALSVRAPSLEELVLAYMANPTESGHRVLTLAGHQSGVAS